MRFWGCFFFLVPIFFPNNTDAMHPDVQRLEQRLKMSYEETIYELLVSMELAAVSMKGEVVYAHNDQERLLPHLMEIREGLRDYLEVMKNKERAVGTSRGAQQAGAFSLGGCIYSIAHLLQLYQREQVRVPFSSRAIRDIFELEQTLKAYEDGLPVVTEGGAYEHNNAQPQQPTAIVTGEATGVQIDEHTTRAQGCAVVPEQECGGREMVRYAQTTLSQRERIFIPIDDKEVVKQEIVKPVPPHEAQPRPALTHQLLPDQGERAAQQIHTSSRFPTFDSLLQVTIEKETACGAGGPYIEIGRGATSRLVPTTYFSPFKDSPSPRKPGQNRSDNSASSSSRASSSSQVGSSHASSPGNRGQAERGTGEMEKFISEVFAVPQRISAPK